MYRALAPVLGPDGARELTHNEMTGSMVEYVSLALSTWELTAYDVDRTVEVTVDASGNLGSAGRGSSPGRSG